MCEKLAIITCGDFQVLGTLQEFFSKFKEKTLLQYFGKFPQKTLLDLFADIP
jgi:hypothetical protein